MIDPIPIVLVILAFIPFVFPICVIIWLVMGHTKTSNSRYYYEEKFRKATRKVSQNCHY